MPYVEVWVDAADLEDFSDEDLREELAARAARKSSGVGNSADYRIPAPVAKYTLDEASQILRKQGRIDLAFKLDEIREDFIGH